MWSRLKKLGSKKSSKAVLEIIRADKSVSADTREVLERWYLDISKLYSGIRSDPEMAFNDNFYEEMVRKKQEFESLSSEQQYERSN